MYSVCVFYQQVFGKLRVMRLTRASSRSVATLSTTEVLISTCAQCEMSQNASAAYAKP